MVVATHAVVWEARMCVAEAVMIFAWGMTFGHTGDVARAIASEPGMVSVERRSP